VKDFVSRPEADRQPTRRTFLARLGRGAAAGGLAFSLVPFERRSEAGEAGQAPPETGTVKKRPLGKTGLHVSEIGFGGHSWAYARVSDGHGGQRKPTLDEAMRMISLGLEMGVNFFDSCTPEEEHTVPGEVIKRLKKRDRVIVSARLCHKMKGVPADREIIDRWVHQRLKLWQTDYFDILMVTNTENDTPQSGYWEMSHSIEAIEKLKREGKIRFAGFGCHFRPEQYLDAFKTYGRSFDICSVPYNIRHRAAESVIPAAKKAGLGMVTIKPFARGALLEGHNLGGSEAGLARDMLAFVLENAFVDCCICGVHTETHVRENFSASWTTLTPVRRRQLERLALRTPCSEHAWLEKGWLC
jgi:aryl-alcohol dehydrogenase-like predicted oxidoreductase